jgi:hypothetical protein
MFEENYDSITVQDEDLIPLNAILEIQSSEIEDYYQRLDAFYDHLDAQWSSFSSFDDYAAMVEQAVATEDAYFQGFLAARFANKKEEEREVVIVTGVRRRAPPSGGSLGPYFTGGGGGVSSLILGLLTDEQKANIRANLKRLFPGLTDTEIDALAGQIFSNLSLAASAVKLAKTIENPKLEKGQVVAYLTSEQLAAINNILNRLGTPQAAAAKQRLDQAIRNGSIRIKSPRGRYGF